MIDTIVLTIPNGYFVEEPDRFRPSCRGLFDDSVKDKGYDKYMLNPSVKDQASGYKPRLTIYRRYFANIKQRPLMIEFSIPKLLYGENISEVKESDFDLIVSTLQERLRQMGVQVFEPLIRNAVVSKVDYSKNIILEKYDTASMIIRDFKRLGSNKRYEINHRHFQNDGHALYYDCSSFQFVLYDKMTDTANISKRHQVDKDRTPQQQSLFEEYQKLDNRKEVLRFELRLQNAKLKALLKEIGFEETITFQNLFKQAISSDLINMHWEKFIKNEAYGLFLLNKKPDEAFISIVRSAKSRIAMEKAFSILGVQMCLNEYGENGTRSTAEKVYHSRTWSRYKDKVKEYLKHTIDLNNNIEYISKSLQQFNPISISDIGLNEVDNVK